MAKKSMKKSKKKVSKKTSKENSKKTSKASEKDETIINEPKEENEEKLDENETNIDEEDIDDNADSDLIEEEENDQEDLDNTTEKGSSGYSYNYDSYMDDDDKIQEQEVDESEVSLYTYCEECSDYVFVKYRKNMITEAKSYPVYLVWVHGRPLHGLLTRIDKNFVSRGERIVHIEFNINDLQNQ